MNRTVDNRTPAGNGACAGGLAVDWYYCGGTFLPPHSRDIWELGHSQPVTFVLLACHFCINFHLRCHFRLCFHCQRLAAETVTGTACRHHPCRSRSSWRRPAGRAGRRWCQRWWPEPRWRHPSVRRSAHIRWPWCRFRHAIVTEDAGGVMSGSLWSWRRPHGARMGTFSRQAFVGIGATERSVRDALPVAP